MLLKTGPWRWIEADSASEKEDASSQQKPAAIFHTEIVSEREGQTNSRPSISTANISISGIHLKERRAAAQRRSRSMLDLS